MTPQGSMRGDVAVLVPAAGLGTRLGPGQPKALRHIGGATLLGHAVRRLCAAKGVGCLVIAAPPGEEGRVREGLTTEVRAGVDLIVVPGGVTRQASVDAALRAAPADFPIVLVHDAARALVPPALVERVAQAVRAGHSAVIPVLPVVDTVKSVDASDHVVATIDRRPLRAVQTPQGFARATLIAIHAAANPRDQRSLVTDDAGLAELAGVPVYCVPGDAAAMKITQPADLLLAELLLQAGS